MMLGTNESSALQSIMSSEGHVIVECPPPELLICNSGLLTCGICQRTFKNPSMLRFHRIKVHKLIQNEAEFALNARRTVAKSLPVHYHCPIITCKYYVNKERFFTEMKNLKQHYMNAHAEKKFSCSQCGQKFGQQRRAAMHEKTCSINFVCEECGGVYKTRDGLHTHCKRHGHTSGFSAINREDLDDGVPPSTVPVTSNTVPVTSNTVPVISNTGPVTFHQVSTYPAMTTATPAVLPPATMQSTGARLAVSSVQTIGCQRTSSAVLDSENVLALTKICASDAPTTVIVPQKSRPHSVTRALPYDTTCTRQAVGGCQLTPLVPQCQLRPLVPPNHSLTDGLLAASPLQHTKPSHSLILPKPDALYIPPQWRTNQNNSGPLVIIFNNVVKVPAGPKHIAPKPLQKSMDVNQLTEGTATPTGRRVTEVGCQGREIEVQTDAVQVANSYCGTDSVANTCELAVQTLPPQYTGHATPHKDCVMAETQTMCNSQYYSAVETQSRSSQVSPKARVYRLAVQDGVTEPMRENDRMTKRKGRKRAEAGSQTQGCGHRSVCVGTPPKRQKKRRNAAVSCSAIVKDVETQSDHMMQVIDIDQNISNQAPRVHTDMSFMHNEVVDLPVRTFVPSSIGTASVPSSHLEAVGVRTISSPLSLNNLGLEAPRGGLAQSTQRTSTEMISVSTDMSRANISVGTMPSPPLPLSDETFGADFPPVSMNTIGTDPLPGFSGSSQRDINFSVMFSQETQTSLWAEIQASIAESNATQTMESYLADTSMNADAASLTMPVVMESLGVQTCHAQNSQTQTWPQLDTTPVSQCKSVGVGTSLLGESHSSSFFEGMESEGLSRSIGIDTQLFDDLFPEVSSRSVAISTPLFENMHRHSSSTSVSQPPVMENTMFQPIDQRSVGVGPLGHDLTDLECLTRPNDGRSKSRLESTLREGESNGMIRYDV